MPEPASPVQVSAYYPVKRILDRIAGLLLIIPALPIVCLLVVLIKLTSRGPGIYSQRRVGRDGRIFTMYKLRSMRIDAETGTGPVWSNPGHDPRITPLGYWLRKLHLDELPQLLNVVRGEMSLIGPRPERPEFVEVLSESISNYKQRLLVEPGITGLAQINLPPDTDLNSVRRKIVLDLEYIRTANFILDFRMFLCTLFRLIGVKGEVAMRLMLLKRTVSDYEFVDAEEATGPGVVTPDVISTRVSLATSESANESSFRSGRADAFDAPNDDDNERTVVFAGH
jgi:lipopolysaccharide/colanic/teichoic acid biosynthesis glycosyltransferase